MARVSRYQVDLQAQQADCDSCYVRLLRLLPALDSRDHWSWLLPLPQGSLEIVISVTERAPYTLSLQVSQRYRGPDLGAHLALHNVDFSARLYLDMRMAEITCWQGQRYWLPRYEYPNKRMNQRDEKAQLNRFFAEWLSYCLRHGRSAIDVAALVN